MDRNLLKKLREKTQEEFLYLNGNCLENQDGITYFGKNQKETSKILSASQPVKMFRQMRFCENRSHYQKYITFHYTCSGNMYHSINGENIQVSQGGILLIASGVTHKTEKAEERDLSIGFLFQPSFLNEIFMLYGLQDSAASFVQEILLGISKEYSYLHFRLSGNRFLENLIENLIVLFMESEEPDITIVRMTFGLIFVSIIKDFQNQFVRNKTENDSRTMLEVIRYVEQNYKAASLQELGERMGVSVASLSRFIKKHSSLTFKEIVLEKRFRVAEEMLTHTTLPVSEISNRIGYENGSHFYQKFQERNGMTPGEFREKKQISKESECEDRILALKRKMDQYWSDRADSYNKQNREQLENSCDKWKELLMKYIPPNRAARILDIGTGPGFFAILLAKEGYSVTAVDRSKEMLQYAKKNAADAGVYIQFLQIEEEIPFQEESFDVVISRDVVWMQLEPEKTLESWYRLVKERGHIVYFDAEWYGYLRNEEERKQYKEFRRFVKAREGFVYSKANELEQMAYEFPLTYQKRPEWDIEFWKELHPQQVLWEEELNSRIYSEMEQLQYAKNPEFLVCIKK